MHGFRETNGYYQKRYQDLEDDCQRLITENATMKEDVGNMTEECTELREVKKKFAEFYQQAILGKTVLYK